MMIKRLFIILSIALSAGLMMAQEPVSDRPQRTPEDEAIKQTVRLVRELDIKDSVRFDTLYKMHLKYARVRQKGLTRAQEMERMNAIYAELKRLLTEKEFDQFMNHPVEQPRRPRGANRMLPVNATPTDKAPSTPEQQKANQ
jgi:hypothetical protein